MRPQRKIQMKEDATESTDQIDASYMHGSIGGQIALWHDQINAAFRDGMAYPNEVTTDSVEILISQISRWSGPAIFLAALVGIIYAL